MRIPSINAIPSAGDVVLARVDISSACDARANATDTYTVGDRVTVFERVRFGATTSEPYCLPGVRETRNYNDTTRLRRCVGIIVSLDAIFGRVAMIAVEGG